MPENRKVLVFSSGTPDGGATGFDYLAFRVHVNTARIKIAAAVSQHAEGGTRRIAENYRIPFIHFPGPWNDDRYRAVAEMARAEWFALYGWTKLVRGLDPRRTFNTYPAPLPRFGGRGMYGLEVHRVVLEAYRAGQIAKSEVCMHFVTPEYDAGPVFFRKSVEIRADDTPETLAARVKETERAWYCSVVERILDGDVHWDGVHAESLVTPPNFLEPPP